MAQHDYVIANANGATVRADINNALLAISSTNSGSSEPSTPYAYEMWVDTSSNLLKLRNAANNAWITLGVSITASNTVDIDGGAIDGTAIGASAASTGNFTSITGSVASTISTADNTDTLSLISTDADAGVGPNLRLYRNSGSPADNDVTGVITFTGKNDAGSPEDVIYARQLSYISDASDGTEDGIFKTQTMLAGTIRDMFNITPTEIVFNEDGQDLDFRVESDNLTHALFVQGSDGNVGLNVSVPDASLHIASNTPTLLFDESDAGQKYRIGSFGGAFAIYDETDTTYRVIVDGSGNVGIGTTGPLAVLTTDPESGNFNATYNDYDGVGLFLRGNGTSGDGNYGPALAFGSCDSDTGYQENKHAAISVVQTDSDPNQIGLAFWTHPTATAADALSEAMRITSAGHITAPNLNQTGSTSNRYPLYWVHTGTTGSIEPYTGSIRAMKKDIADMGSVDWIHSLTPRSFKFRDYTTDSEGNRTYLETTNDLPNTEYGLIAEEADEVSGSDYILDKDTDDNVKGVLYHNLVPILLKAVQELKTELDSAKARITTLEG